MDFLEGHFDYMLIPTLRIVMTSECNGKCFFCHREGSNICLSTCNEMSLETINNEIIPAIQKIGIRKVIFTGGEPTTHKELFQAIQMVKKSCKDVQVGVTTNGYNIEQLTSIKEYIDRITISISSLKKEIFMHYTMIDPLDLIAILKQFNSTKKSVSIVVTKENVTEIKDMIDLFTRNNFDVKLQFVISQTDEDLEWERRVIHSIFEIYGCFKIKLKSTPVLYKKMENGRKINIKWSSLNDWMYNTLVLRESCIKCEKKNECVEKGCSIRVFADGKVTPCLNQFLSFTEESIETNLINAYQAMEISKK